MGKHCVYMMNSYLRYIFLFLEQPKQYTCYTLFICNILLIEKKETPCQWHSTHVIAIVIVALIITYICGALFLVSKVVKMFWSSVRQDDCVWFVICPYGNSFDPRAFRWAQTMKLAVEEINQREDLLPDHVLGYKLFDSCGYPLTGQRAALSLLNGPGTDGSSTCTGTAPLLAVIGESSSSLSVMLSRILQPFKIPVVITALCFLSKKNITKHLFIRLKRRTGH